MAPRAWKRRVLAPWPPAPAPTATSMPSSSTASTGSPPPRPGPRASARPELLPGRIRRMLTAPTLDQLQSLKLTAMATAWQDQQRSAEWATLTFEERFGLLVEAEW